MAVQNCHCEKNAHAKEKKVQIPGLWSSLGCMITDDITKCIGHSATHINGMHINDLPPCRIISAVDLPSLSTSYNFKNLKVLNCPAMMILLYRKNTFNITF
jgi:hypothetical protein